MNCSITHPTTDSIQGFFENYFTSEVQQILPKVLCSFACINEQDLDEELSKFPLSKQECEYLEKCRSKKRKIQFSLGRVAARKALKKISSNISVIDSNNAKELFIAENGILSWPHGYSGSISHTEQFAVSTIVSKDNFLSVGIDIEKIKSNKYYLSPKIATKREQDWLNDREESQKNKLFYFLFSAKESLFKAVSNAYGIKLRYHDSELIFIPETKHFEGRITDINVLNKTLDRFKNDFFEPDKIFKIKVTDYQDFILSYVFIDK